MTLNPIFADHMVLAADREIRVFGEGAGKAEVHFCGHSACLETTEPEWVLTLPAMKSGGPYEMTIELNGKQTVLRDVYVGRVYLMAGQSNMQFTMEESVTPPEEYVPNPLLRSFFLQRPEERQSFKPGDGWVLAEEPTIPNWSALGYLIAQRIQRESGEAVGVICCYQGASGILSWLPENFPCDVPHEQLHFDYEYEGFRRWNEPGMLYRSMFRRLCPFGMTGAAWYQGESDTADAETARYADWLREMVSQWRRDLMDEKLFFAVVQIADYDSRNDAVWHTLQQAQVDAVQRMERSALVVSRDVCETGNIHPADKRLLALRIADALMKGCTD